MVVCGFDLTDVIEGRRMPMTVRRIVALVALGLFFAALPASAQESSWGVSGSFVPSWSVPAENVVARALFNAVITRPAINP